MASGGDDDFGGFFDFDSASGQSSSPSAAPASFQSTSSPTGVDAVQASSGASDERAGFFADLAQQVTAGYTRITQQCPGQPYFPPRHKNNAFTAPPDATDTAGSPAPSFNSASQTPMAFDSKLSHPLQAAPTTDATSPQIVFDRNMLSLDAARNQIRGASMFDIRVEDDDYEPLSEGEIEDHTLRVFNGVLQAPANAPSGLNTTQTNCWHTSQQRAHQKCHNLLQQPEQISIVSALARLLVEEARALHAEGLDYIELNERSVKAHMNHPKHFKKNPPAVRTSTGFKLDLGIKFSARMQKIVYAIESNALVKLDFVKGCKVHELVRCPTHVLSRKMADAKSNPKRDEFTKEGKKVLDLKRKAEEEEEEGEEEDFDRPKKKKRASKVGKTTMKKAHNDEANVSSTTEDRCIISSNDSASFPPATYDVSTPPWPYIGGVGSASAESATGAGTINPLFNAGGNYNSGMSQFSGPFTAAGTTDNTPQTLPTGLFHTNNTAPGAQGPHGSSHLRGYQSSHAAQNYTPPMAESAAGETVDSRISHSVGADGYAPPMAPQYRSPYGQSVSGAEEIASQGRSWIGGVDKRSSNHRFH